MPSTAVEAVKRLSRGPTFLLIGQRYLALQQGTDPLLDEIRRKFGIAGESRGYFDLLARRSGDPDEAVLAWLAERCRRISPPAWLATVAEFAWSGVFSSAFDTIWTEAFRTTWRELQPVFNDAYRPIDPRNRTLLHCTYCFGSTSRTEPSERPPLSKFDLSARTQVATALLRRLPELLTPLGTLFIEGHAGTNDWLTPETLMPALASLTAGQVHLFSVNDDLAMEPFTQELAQRGILRLHRESLGGTIGEAVNMGLARLGPPDVLDSRQPRLTIGDVAHGLPTDLRNRVQQSAVLLDDSVTSPPPALSADAKYLEFREFLASSDGVPKWSGFGRGFAFKREYGQHLRAIVDKRLQHASELREHPVVLHGPTGSGKTVTLAALAFEIRRATSYPVLFIERKSRRPHYADLEAFCRWCEDRNAAGSLIVWDGMIETRDYIDLQRYLASRGRKVVVVGSSYLISDITGSRSDFVLSPGELIPGERRLFAEFLREQDSALTQIAERLERLEDKTFLVALYRLLPPTRGAVRAGVSREIEQTEASLAAMSVDLPSSGQSLTTLGAALAAAGFSQAETLSSEVTRSISGEALNDFQDLTALVMVPGAYGIRTPLEPILRALGHARFAGLIDLLKPVDIIRWYEDAVGNLELGPRTALEAQIIVQSRLGGPSFAIPFVRRLLAEVRDVHDEPYMSREGAFAADLIRSFGPSGPDALTYAPHFKELAETLTEVRARNGFANPGLMLAEAHLYREWAKHYSERQGHDSEIYAAALSEGKAVVRKALEVTSQDRASYRRVRSQLLAELAAATGMECRKAVDEHAPAQYVLNLLSEVRQAVFDARREDPNAYHPLDIFAWVVPRVINHVPMSDVERGELVADLVNLFQSADADEFDFQQQERFYTRRIEIADLLGNTEVSEEAFAALNARGSAAGYYLRATQIGGILSEGSPSIDRACEGAAYLDSHRARIQHDWRSLMLLLRLRWLCLVREPLFRGERVSPPLTFDQWRELLGLIREIEALGPASRVIELAFLRGVCLFHLGNVGEALEVFRNEVENESRVIQGRRRIVRTFVASQPNGEPQKFHGTVSWVSADQRRGEVFVDELRRRLHFLTNDFGLHNAEAGRSLGEFHIAFNLLGAIVEPTQFAVERRRSGRRV